MTAVAAVSAGVLIILYFLRISNQFKAEKLIVKKETGKGQSVYCVVDCGSSASKVIFYDAQMNQVRFEKTEHPVQSSNGFKELEEILDDSACKFKFIGMTAGVRSLRKSDQDEVIQKVKEKLGGTVKLLTSEEEAEFFMLSAEKLIDSLGIEETSPWLAVDIGGRSIQVVGRILSERLLTKYRKKIISSIPLGVDYAITSTSCLSYATCFSFFAETLRKHSPNKLYLSSNHAFIPILSSAGWFIAQEFITKKFNAGQNFHGFSYGDLKESVKSQCFSKSLTIRCKRGIFLCAFIENIIGDSSGTEIKVSNQISWAHGVALKNS
jgi:Ppx/GppA phosphatase family